MGWNRALMELSKHTDTILSKADEVGAVVIMRVNEYTKEDKQQLNNHEGYKKTEKILQKRTVRL